MPTDPALAHVLTALAACRAVLASGAVVSAPAPRGGLILPPYDEDGDVRTRIAMYERWLRRNAPEELHDASS
jgi:hypothetical protein